MTDNATSPITGIRRGAVGIRLGEKVPVGIEGLGGRAESELLVGDVVGGGRDGGRQAAAGEAASGGEAGPIRAIPRRVTKVRASPITVVV